MISNSHCRRRLASFCQLKPCYSEQQELVLQTANPRSVARHDSAVSAALSSPSLHRNVATANGMLVAAEYVLLNKGFICSAVVLVLTARFLLHVELPFGYGPLVASSGQAGI